MHKVTDCSLATEGRAPDSRFVRFTCSDYSKRFRSIAIMLFQLDAFGYSHSKLSVSKPAFWRVVTLYSRPSKDRSS